ncbi:unnamed protein product, partial [Adineta ricciae]
MTNHNKNWWIPTHICYNQSQCPRLSFPNSSVVNGLLCVKTEFSDGLNDGSEQIRLTFSSCRPLPESVLNHATIPYLFYCNQSMKYISKHRVGDEHVDCVHKDDEYENIDWTVINNLNLTDRFQCPQTSDWLPSVLAVHHRCHEESIQSS